MSALNGVRIRPEIPGRWTSLTLDTAGISEFLYPERGRFVAYRRSIVDHPIDFNGLDAPPTCGRMNPFHLGVHLTGARAIESRWVSERNEFSLLSEHASLSKKKMDCPKIINRFATGSQ